MKQGLETALSVINELFYLVSNYNKLHPRERQQRIEALAKKRKKIRELIENPNFDLSTLTQSVIKDASIKSLPKIPKVSKISDQRRFEIKALYNYRCIKCGQCGDKKRILTVHHLEKVANGGTHDTNNVCCICRDCHDDWHNRVEKSAIMVNSIKSDKEKFWSWIESGI